MSEAEEYCLLVKTLLFPLQVAPPCVCAPYYKYDKVNKWSTQVNIANTQTRRDRDRKVAKYDGVLNRDEDS